MRSRPSLGRLAAAFLILFALYQSAEGVGARLLDSFPVQAGLMVAAVLAAWPLGRWLGYRGYDAFGLDKKLASLGLCLALVLLALAARAAVLVGGVAMGGWTLAPVALPSAEAAAMSLLAMAVSSFVPSLAEDMLTRGFFLRAANPGWNGLVFVIGTAALFVLNHIYRLDWHWSEHLRLFAIGLACAAAAWRWRTLWGAVGIHWGYNLGAMLTGPLIVDAPGADPHLLRWLTLAAHLALLAVVLLLPARPARTRIRG